MNRNSLIALVVVIAAIAGYLYYQEQKDDVKIKLPGDNEITIDQ